MPALRLAGADEAWRHVVPELRVLQRPRAHGPASGVRHQRQRRGALNMLGMKAKHRLPRDKQTGRSLPSGVNLAKQLHRIYRRIEADVLAKLNRGRIPDLYAWQQIIEDTAQPYFWSLIWLGVEDQQKRPTAVGYKPWKVPRRSPEILAQSREAAHQFAVNTLQAMREKIGDLVALAAAEAGGGRIDRKGLRDKMRAALFTRKRALVQAQYQASMLYHRGGERAATGAGMRHKQWLCGGPAPCKACRDLAGKTVPINDAFVILGRGPYDVIREPGLHPGCLCSCRYLP